MDNKSSSGGDMTRRRWLRGAAAVVGTLSTASLSACGGGGNSDAVALAPPTQDPTPAPTAIPPLSQAKPFRNARTGLQYATLQAALDAGGSAAAVSGDTIKVAAGTYIVTKVDDVGSMAYVLGGLNYGVLLDTLTIEWETPGSPPLIDISQWAAAANASGGEGHGIIMGKTCTKLTVRGLQIRGHRGDYGLNSGVFVMSGYGNPIDYSTPATLIVEHCKLYEFANGILTRPYYQLSAACRYSVFQDNGKGDGLSHGVYISDNLAAEFLGCTFRTTSNSKPQPGLGHLIKSRAKTTSVRGCLFDPAYGTATCMDFPNGGSVTVAGNVVNHYGAVLFIDDNPTIKFGEEQQPTVNANSPLFTGGDQTDNFVHDGRTHSITIAQNTFRRLQPEGGQPFNIVNISIPKTDWTTNGVPTPKSSGGTGGDVGTTVTRTVRNNIVANDTGTATNFVAAYPNNSSVAYSTVDSRGTYSGAVIAGNPAINDAAYAWAGDYAIPKLRTDTNRGGVLP